jgi:hypothetical protein
MVSNGGRVGCLELSHGRHVGLAKTIIRTNSFSFAAPSSTALMHEVSNWPEQDLPYFQNRQTARGNNRWHDRSPLHRDDIDTKN